MHFLVVLNYIEDLFEEGIYKMGPNARGQDQLQAYVISTEIMEEL